MRDRVVEECHECPNAKTKHRVQNGNDCRKYDDSCHARGTLSAACHGKPRDQQQEWSDQQSENSVEQRIDFCR